MAVNESFEQRLLETFWDWSQWHPEPDIPFLETSEGKKYTPTEVAREMVDRTPFGTKQIEVYKHFVAVEGNEEILTDFKEIAIFGQLLVENSHCTRIPSLDNNF